MDLTTTVETTETISIGTQCDRCKKRIEINYPETFKCTIERELGEAYHAGGDKELEHIDLCQNCATWLMKKLVEFDIRINKSSWDW